MYVLVRHGVIDSYAGEKVSSTAFLNLEYSQISQLKICMLLLLWSFLEKLVL